MKKQLFSLAMLFLGLMALNAQTIVWSDNFDDEDVSDWSLYDEDGDGIQWADIFAITDNEGNPVTPVSLISRSWQSEPLTPDNWIVSPAVDLTNSTGTIVLNWKVQAAAETWDMENYTVYVATANDLVTLEASATMFTETYDDPANNGPQLERELDLSNFAGQTVYIAFRHHDCTDQDFLSIDDVSVSTSEVGPAEGCLEAENGQYPSDTFVPVCDGTAQDITESAWTGEYSLVTVTSGEEYTFTVSDPTYFITISDEAGTAVLASGTASVTWTATMAGNVRFYTHFNSDCEWDDETTFARTVQCGEFTPPTEYCIPVLTCTDGDLITNVTFAGINNDSDCSEAGYGDYTAMQAEVVAGETYSMSVTVGAGWDFESTMVWIDFNNDFIFDPVTEYFFIGSDPGTTNTADITIPAGTADGEYRLRVRVGAINPDLNDLSTFACEEESDFGETEDYTLTVGDGGGPSEDCEQIFTGEATGASGSSSPFMTANDIEVEANKQFTLESISVDVVPAGGEVTTFDVYVYEDNNGPGAQIGSGHFGLTPSSVTANGFLFDSYQIYTVNLELPTAEILSGGTAGAKYWVAVIMGPSTTEEQVFWIFSPYDSASGSEPLYQSVDDGGSWAPYADDETGENAEGVMSVFGTCGELGVSDMESFDFAYYPNPVKDELNITSQKLVQSVSIYNLAGQQLSTQKLNVTNGKVSTSTLPAGVYVFRAVLEDGQIETFKIIKK